MKNCSSCKKYFQGVFSEIYNQEVVILKMAHRNIKFTLMVTAVICVLGGVVLGRPSEVNNSKEAVSRPWDQADSKAEKAAVRNPREHVRGLSDVLSKAVHSKNPIKAVSEAAHDGKEKVLEKVRELLAATSNVRELLSSTKNLVKERLGLVKEGLKELRLICIVLAAAMFFVLVAGLVLIILKIKETRRLDVAPQNEDGNDEIELEDICDTPKTVTNGD